MRTTTDVEFRCGIVGRPGDEQVASVRRCLRERGVDPVHLDLSKFPARTALSLRDGVPWSPKPAGFARVRTWYVRSMPLPLPFFPGGGGRGADAGESGPQAAVERDRELRVAYAAGRERRSFGFSFLAALDRDGARLVNSPGTFAQHFLKLEQLRALRDAGVPVPSTLASNDPDAVLEFARELDGPIVYKPLAGGALCRRITAEDLRPERLRLLASAPVLFQEEIPGTDIRVYVVADEVAASYRIVSDRIDYRGAETAVLPTVLTPAEHDACRAAARACTMTFTGIDIRRRSDGGFALLECNPSPMFAAIERRTGADPVSRALADLLTHRRQPDTA
ncbi:RimK family alpha-L-glutamate ligase [Embleya sp. NPDC008237]|uniref:ATP-grasp domain-containing protein n=1 Tax=Embleya sp. NPDC008237 TaxID=3363978 RepID=UPI0036E55D5C